MDQPLRIAVLCSFNLDLARGPLQQALSKRGIEAECYFSGYGQWETDALNPVSELYSFAADVILLFCELDDLVPAFHDGDMLPDPTGAADRAKAAWQRVERALTAIRRQAGDSCTLLVQDFMAAPVTPLGLLEGNGRTYRSIADRLNQQLSQWCARHSAAYTLDYAALVADHGWQNWHDPRLWFLGRMKLGRAAINALTEYVARQVAALNTPRRKCLVLDLDNTLWGGVVGEDGIAGLELGHQGSGLAYREFQLAALALWQRGIVLAVASKNNPADALSVFDQHPDMVLRQEHLACCEINWQPKSHSLRRIAQRLEIGLDSLVFWDDNPREREEVAAALPQVQVVDVPQDPADYVAALMRLECFDTLALTPEDERRGAMYREQVERKEFLASSDTNDLQAYYHSLDMQVKICEADGLSLPRVAQLSQRTNQFNFTRKRYTLADVRSLMAEHGAKVYTIGVRDRFGDLGLVGAAIVMPGATHWKIDSLLLSCRSLGRGAEDALLAHVKAEAETNGAGLTGTFVSGPRNQPARAFLERVNVEFGFPTGDETPFRVKTAPFPTWIKVNGVSSPTSREAA